MEEHRRLNPDRRILEKIIDLERRIIDERREIFSNKKLVGKLKEILIFSELTNDEFKKVLSVCSREVFSKNEIIYHEGSTADNMYILIDGVLEVTLEGKELRFATPLSVIGDMGIFTRKPRSATITAKTDCILLKLTKIELSNLFKRTDMLDKRFYLGMIKELSNKLRKVNRFIIKLKK
ncbi:cyclic nucleotide-binding domain-containing protein [Candidatus Latescibacterota bacterium]